MVDKRQDVNLEDLISQTEQRILNNEYYEDVVVKYSTDSDDYNLHVRIRPISQAKFAEVSKKKSSLDNAEFNTLIIKECVLNKHDNKTFTREQIDKLFTGGLASVLAMKCLEVSGIPLDKAQFNDLKNY